MAALRRVAHPVGMAERLTSQQTADRLAVHRSTVHRWVAEGKLTPAQVVHLGDVTAYLFDADYVAELAARQRSA